MSLHEEVNLAIQLEIDSLGSAIALSPTSVAIAVHRRFAGDQVEPHLQYLSLEHLKQMTRVMLGRRFNADSEESVAYQGELFSRPTAAALPDPASQRT